MNQALQLLVVSTFMLLRHWFRVLNHEKKAFFLFVADNRLDREACCFFGSLIT